jgi:flagellum-specific peptidoglycan hydrolase FlgJ
MAQMYYHHATTHARSSNAHSSDNLLHEPVLWRCLLLAALTYLVWSEKILIVFDFTPRHSVGQTTQRVQNVRASMLTNLATIPEAKTSKKHSAKVLLPAGAQGHSTFIVDPDFARRNGTDPAQAATSTALCREYIERFAPVAVAEMRKFGVPASVILAQGLLESNAGDSKLARATNNHFAIKCFSNKCKMGHCTNVTDHSHKDFFVRYDNVWSSYRAHSTFLKKSRRFAHLFRLESTDHQGWARGLANAGYTTDKRYAEKLLALIYNLDLHTYDRQLP